MEFREVNETEEQRELKKREAERNRSTSPIDMDVVMNMSLTQLKALNEHRNK